MKKALLSLVIIFAVWFVLMQIIPGNTVQADVTSSVHFITGVQITNTDGTPLGSGVSKSAAIKLNYDFSIDNINAVHEGNTFTLNIPNQIKILAPVDFTIISSADNTSKIADGTLTTDGTITLTFTDFASTHYNVHGSFWFDLQFNKDHIGNTNPQDIVFNIGGTADSVTIPVDFEQPASPNASIKKSGELTAANEITWTITANPENVALNNAQVVDSIASGQEFTDGSVTINGAAAQPTDYTVSGGILTCNFPAALNSQQIITFKTKVLDSEFSKAKEGDTLHEGNTATLTHDKTSVASNPATVDVPVNYIDKSGEYDATTKTIKWTVNVDEINVTINNPVVTDTLPSGVSLVADSIQVDGAALNPPYTVDASAAPVIKFSLGTSITGPHVITFSATVDSVTCQASGSPSYHNVAVLTGDGVPDGTASSDDVTVPSIVIKKVSSAYNSATHQIAWQVTINTNNITIADGIFTDHITPGQEYVQGSASIVDSHGVAVDASKYSFTPASPGDTTNNGTLKYTFTDTINSTYVLTFNTAVTDPTIYAGNTPDTLYNNTAYFDGKVDGASVPTSHYTDSAVVSSKVISKTCTNYNYQTNEITWNIEVDGSKTSLEDVVITDPIPFGQEYVNDNSTTTIDGGASSSGFNFDSSANTLTYTFPGVISQTYNIKFNTKIKDPSVFATNGEKTIKNTATIKDKPIPGGIDSTGSTTIENMVISNGATYDKGNKYIDWTVEVNMHGMNLTDPMITDQLQEGLDLDTSTVELYNETVNSDGSTTVGSKIPLTNDNVDYKSATRLFNFSLPNGTSDAYMLTFRTIVTDQSKSPFTNTASLVGTGFTQSNSTKSIDVYYTDSGSTGYGDNVGSIKILKADSQNHNKFLPNAKFELLDQYGSSFTDGFTDANGSIVFGLLHLDVNYTVKELSPPDGYKMSDNQYTFQIKSTDAAKDIAYTFYDDAAKGNIAFTKIDGGSGQLLGGAIFSLYVQGDPNNTVVATATSDSNGSVEFKDIPVGAYTIKETTPPVGYLASPDTLSASLKDDGVTVTPTDADGKTVGSVADTLMRGNIQFNKKDSQGSNLPGAVFALKDAKGNVVATATSDNDGLVYFKNIPYGSYNIIETKVPVGHAIYTDPITTSITQDGPLVYASPSTIVDGDQCGNIQFTKTDGKNPLPNAEFTLYNSTGDHAITTAASDSKGVVLFSGIPLGNYIIRETAAPEGYSAYSSDIKVSVTEVGKTVTPSPATIADTQYLGNIQVIKTATDGSTKLSGATFKLYSADDTNFDTPLSTAVSGSDGTALFQNIPYGSYAIREISAPSGYYINNTILYPKINQNGATVSAGTLPDTKIPAAATSLQTGDNILNYALIMAAAAAAAVVIFITRNKKKMLKYKSKH